MKLKITQDRAGIQGLAVLDLDVQQWVNHLCTRLGISPEIEREQAGEFVTYSFNRNSTSATLDQIKTAWRAMNNR